MTDPSDPSAEVDPMAGGRLPVGSRWNRRSVLQLLGGSAAAVALGACSTSDSSDGAVARTTTTAGTHPTTTTGASTSTTAAATTTVAGPASASDWTALGASLQGALVRPGDRDYDAERVLFNPLFDGVRPQGVARCASSDDVAQVLRFARAHEIPFSVRSGGHSFAGYSTNAGLVIDMTPMSGVQSAGNGTAIVGAGTRLIDVYAGLAKTGEMIPAGSCPTVGVAGLTLGGGVGVVSRKYGLTIDSLRSAEVVLADGRVVTCDEQREPDLFWALRGGGAGNFGVVTAFGFATNSAPTLALGGVRFPWAAAHDVVAAWLDWAPHAPDELWSNLLLLAEAPRGGSPTVRVGGVHVGPLAELDGLLDDLVHRVGTQPTKRYRKTAGYLDAMRFEGGCSDLSVAQCRLPSQGSAGRLAREASVARAEYLSAPLPGAAIDLIVRAVEHHQTDEGLAGGGVAFDAYGGAINRVGKGDTAFVHRGSICGLLLNGTFPDAAPKATVEAAERWVDGLGADLQPYVNGEAYQNYVDPRRKDWARAYYGSNLARLQQVKRHYDPDEVFRFEQSIRPA